MQLANKPSIMILCQVNDNGKIEFTKEELEKIILEAYQKGVTESQKYIPYFCSPSCSNGSHT